MLKETQQTILAATAPECVQGAGGAGATQPVPDSKLCGYKWDTRIPRVLLTYDDLLPIAAGPGRTAVRGTAGAPWWSWREGSGVSPWCGTTGC